MQIPAEISEPAQHQAKPHGDHHHRPAHQRIDQADHQHRTQHRRHRRQHVPHGQALDAEHRIAGRRNAPGQHAGAARGEEARRMAERMVEQIAPDIAGDLDEGARRDPAADAPGQIIHRDQPRQQDKGGPNPRDIMPRQHVHHIFDRILRRHGTADAGQHREQNDDMRPRMARDRVQHEAHRPPLEFVLGCLPEASTIRQPYLRLRKIHARPHKHGLCGSKKSSVPQCCRTNLFFLRARHHPSEERPR